MPPTVLIPSLSNLPEFYSRLAVGYGRMVDDSCEQH